jgi:hypothetical protein
VELLAGAVELKVGVRPDSSDVAEFLASLGKHAITDPSNPGAFERTNRPAESNFQVPAGETIRGGQLVLRGKAYSYSSAKDAMVIVLRELAKDDATFLERCSRHPDAQGRKRRYIARTPEEIYPDREDLRDYREPLPGGWFVATNLNNVLKKTIIRLAADVAGLRFGTDLRVEF